MVLLVERFYKLYSKLENHHHHRHQQQEALSASLQAFKSDVSSCINHLCLNLKPGSEILSLSWIQRCFQLLPLVNKAFAKLVVDIDHHVGKWKSQSIEEYLRYSLSLLDLLNSISYSLSQLRQLRLSLSHALTLVESSPSSAIEHLKAIQFKSSSKEFEEQESEEDEVESPCSTSDKELIINQALVELKSVGLWVCCVVLAGLCGDAKAYLKTRKSYGIFSSSLFANLDKSICEAMVEKGVVLKEVEELNDAAACLAADMTTETGKYAAEEMQRKLNAFEKLLDGLEKEVNLLFSETLARRNELLDGVRHQQQ